MFKEVTSSEVADTVAGKIPETYIHCTKLQSTCKVTHLEKKGS